eukprot:Gb_09090 [translate_table: standard]
MAESSAFFTVPLSFVESDQDEEISVPTSSNRLSSRIYDVFINHRGPDVKNTLASSIYHWLQRTGLLVFFDTEEFQPGEQLQHAVAEAIRTASVHIAIFSKGYAESPWCLNELSSMLKTREKIIPVFYDVEPSDLRRLEKGVYADAFMQHEKKNRYESHMLEEWKNALKKVADYSGLELKKFGGDQGKMLKTIVDNVLRDVKRVRLEIGGEPVGLDQAVECFENFMAEQSEDVKTVGIVGLKGSGKTTLAKELYNRKRKSFERSSFLSGVGEASAKNALQSLQCQLLKELVHIDRSINNTSEGKGMLREYLRYWRVFVVMDDIDHEDQLDALLVEDVLGSGSLIIVTARDRSVLKLSGISLHYGVTALDLKHAQQLFCRHAFHQPHPRNGFEDVVRKVLIKCGGFPLLLKFIGRHLRLYGNNDIASWEDELEKISELRRGILQGGYDSLSEEEKEIFVDIACFFLGEDKNLAIRIWNGSGWRGSRGVQTLDGKGFVELDEQNRLKMHDYLREFGREIADHAGSPCRLWLPHQAANILKRCRESLEIRGIIAATRNPRFSYSYCASYYQPPFEQIQQSGDDINTFSVGLKLLVIQGSCFNSKFSSLSRDLLWLRWFECPLASIRSWLSLENLRVLELIGGSLQELWVGYEQAPLQLRELNIVSSSQLGRLPKSIVLLKHLEKIVLVGPNRIQTLPEEICCLPFLKHLELRGCSKLLILPESFCLLTQLEHLDLSSCESLHIQPEIFVKIRSLRLLDLVGTCLKESSNELEKLTNLDVLKLGSPFLLSLPNLTSLTQLHLENCTQLKGQLNLSANLNVRDWEIEYLPKGVEQLSNLKTLFVYNCPISELIFTNLVEEGTVQDLKQQSRGCMNRLKSIEVYKTKLTKISLPEDVFPKLTSLILSDNIHLMEVETLPQTLVQMSLNRCKVLKRISGIFHLSKLQMLNISGCEQLGELPSLTHLSSLRRLEAAGCHKLQGIEGLVHLTNLRHLDISHCYQLDELPSLKLLSSLNELIINGCFKMQSIEDLAHLTSLETLQAVGCRKLQNVKGLECLAKLQQINISNCDRLVDLPSLAYLTSLKNLIINGCGKLSGVGSLASLTSLETVEASRCWKLKSIKGLETLAKLRQLNISHCCTLNELSSLQHLSSLESLIINGCLKLETIDGLASLKSMKFLSAGGCWKLHSVEGLDQLAKLQQLNIGHSNQLVELPSLALMKSLKILIISGCRKLQKIGGLADLRSLEIIEAGGCWKLQSLEGVEHLEKLQRLNVNQCYELHPKLPNLNHLNYLKDLIIKGCRKLQSIDGLAHLRSLEKLEAGGCWRLRSIEGVENLANLQQLNISHCCELDELPDLANLISLKKLIVNGCVKLQSIEGMANLKSLETLEAGSHLTLQSMVGVGYLASLQQLKITQCYKLDELECLARLSALQNLTLDGCLRLHSIQGLVHLKCLETLKASGCWELQSLEGLQHLTSLRHLDIGHCYKLDDLPSVVCLSSLKKLKIESCVNLQSIQGLANLRSLESFEADGCQKLRSVEGIEQLTNLKELNISHCYELNELPSLEHLSSLKSLIINGCSKLQSIEGLASLRALEMFKSSGCLNLQNVKGLEPLEFLRQLQLSADNGITLQLARLPSTLNLSGRAVPDVDSILKSADFTDVTMVEPLPHNIHPDYWELKMPLRVTSLWSAVILCFVVQNPILEGQRVWISIFSQDSRFMKRIKNNNKVKVRKEWWDDGGDAHYDMKKAWLVMVGRGEEGKILQVLDKIFKIGVRSS